MVSIGDRFERLVVLNIEDTTRSGNHRYARVRCDCGKEKDVRIANLKYGATKSCGCLQPLTVSNLQYDRWESDPRNDRIGQRHGHLTVIKRDYSKHPNNNIYWVCVCDCGRQLSVVSYNLNRDNGTQSCRPCYRKGVV